PADRGGLAVQPSDFLEDRHTATAFSPGGLGRGIVATPLGSSGASGDDRASRMIDLNSLFRRGNPGFAGKVDHRSSVFAAEISLRTGWHCEFGFGTVKPGIELVGSIIN